jgi:hypothetical protein
MRAAHWSSDSRFIQPVHSSHARVVCSKGNAPFYTFVAPDVQKTMSGGRSNAALDNRSRFDRRKVMKRIRMHLLPVLAIAATLSVGTSSVFAQTDAAQPQPQASAPAARTATTKAQRKAARKEARAKKNAELKKLEDAGYNPATRDDENYSKDLQNAGKKAGSAHAASQ